MNLLAVITPLLQAEDKKSVASSTIDAVTKTAEAGDGHFNILSIISLFVGLVALASYANERFVKLPSAVGTMLAGIFFALILLAVGQFGLVDEGQIAQILTKYTTEFVLSLLLGVLLFATAMQLDTGLITEHRWSITYAATLGTAISIALAGLAIWAFLNLVNIFISWDFGITIVAAFLFAAIVAPTDSVAVLSIIQRIKVSNPIRAYISGEALFNDATAIVLFVLILQFAQRPDSIQPGNLIAEFFWIAGAAVALGLGTGFVGAYLVGTTEKGKSAVLITVGIALGTGGLADILHTSNAIAVAVAGLTFAQCRSQHMTKRDGAIHNFWNTIDGIVNPLFFALIGLELLVVEWSLTVVAASLLCLPAILLARYASLLLPWLGLRQRSSGRISHAALVLMTWIGIRGGVSFALALSIPSDSVYRSPAITGTFVVVILSVLIQGLSVPAVAKRLAPSLSGAK